MIFLDKPFVSDFLQKTLVELDIPVISTPNIDDLGLRSDLRLISKQDAAEKIQSEEHPLIYSNSENAIQWISGSPEFDAIKEIIKTFKDKVLFRELIKPMYPDYYFKSLDLSDLNMMENIALSYPLILKPAIGFFSMGVYKLNQSSDWKVVNEKIQSEFKLLEHLYPVEVFDSSKYILEACIQGREFAIDAYFNGEGESAILNIMEHYFSSDEDVSDRLYTTSSIIIRQYLSLFHEVLDQIGTLANLKNFPVHLEVRITDAGEIIPIEVNPMRFGGWCTTADLAAMAFGFNPYELFFKGEKPDWDLALRDKENKTFNIMVLENSTGVEGKDISSFNYEGLVAKFQNVLELRKVDYKKYPVFGFLFLESRADEPDGVEEILTSNLKEFITT